MSPVVHGEKGTHKELLDKLRADGYARIRVNGEVHELTEEISFEKNIKDYIDVVIDRLIIKEGIRGRLFESVEAACKLSKGKVVIEIMGDKELVFSELYACPHCEFSLPELEPRMFSFNAPYCACPDCKGLGIKLSIDPELVVPDKDKTLEDGAIVTLGDDTDNIYYKRLECMCKHYKISTTKPFKKLTKKEQDLIFYGSLEPIKFNFASRSGNITNQTDYYEGVINNLQRRYMETSSSWIREWLENYMIETECETCHGARLNDDALSVYVGGKNIFELTSMSIDKIIEFFDNLKLSNEQAEIANLLIKEIKSRLSFLSNVGLEYLTLSRMAGTLSGGELQRIRLATQIGSRLTGVLYVLDEPSIGLHQRDNIRLINSLKDLRDLGNTVIVVEHDKEMMLASDYIIDMGPMAGRKGGKVVFQGVPGDLLKEDTLTANYLGEKMHIDVPAKRREGNGKSIIIRGASGNNLKHIDVEFPLGKLILITGVSGSGKSTLINETLQPILSKHFYRSLKSPMPYEAVEGIEFIDKVVNVNQAPIGRTPRSNPATYTGVFSDIRTLFVNLPEAKIRGYKPGRFSFNVKGGRCEACGGNGYKTIEMNFLPDVMVPCEVCHGKRYNRETLEVRYKGKSIADVLDMTINQAVEFFENVPAIIQKIKTLQDVGLGYIKLGQSSTTLSGGESQRVKLATELSKRDTGRTLYILDEPTTGLHFEDIRILMEVLQKLVDRGNTVIVIEHNLDVIKLADHIIDMGPEGGRNGGTILSAGTPEEVAKSKKGYTPKFLKEELR